jgi:arylsulfatase A-like enzyme
MPAPDGRNVLFVVLDTVRKDHLTPYGYDRPTTPALERFAREALVYENAVAQAPWTLPVHASMFTGRYPSEHTATQESPYLPEDVGTLAEALAAVGYRTACFSSNAWITPYTRLTAGFDEHDSFFEALPGGIATSTAAALWQRLTDGRLRPLADRAVEVGNVIHERLAARRSESKTPAIVDRTRRFVGDTDGRWFAFVNLMDAHLPYYPPEEYRATFAPNVDPNGVCQNSKSYNAGARSITEAEFDSIRRLYDAELRHMDAELDRLFEWLKRTDRWEDTVVIVCADHGELHGEFGLYGHEFAVYDPLINVPLVMKHPDLPAGRTERTVELLDLYHTVLESAAAVDAPGRVGGRSFDPGRSLLSAGRSVPDAEYAFAEYHRPVIERRQLRTKAEQAGIDIDEEPRFDSRMCAVRGADAKYIRNARFPDEAYRVDEGLTENESIEPDGPVAAELSAVLDRFGARVGSACVDDGDDTTNHEADSDAEETISGMDPVTRRRLRDLGYR